MTKHLWRFLLTMSLLLTLPLQGYAAARMVSCDAVLARALSEAAAASPHRTVQEASPGMLPMTPGAVSIVMSHGMSGHESMQVGTGDGDAHGDTDGTAHGANHGVAHDGMSSGSHDSHGASCPGCTPCSPGATLTCFVPGTISFVSARVLPPCVVPPTSAELAHPERPPQAFLA